MPPSLSSWWKNQVLGAGFGVWVLFASPAACLDGLGNTALKENPYLVAWRRCLSAAGEDGERTRAEAEKRLLLGFGCPLAALWLLLLFCIPTAAHVLWVSKHPLPSPCSKHSAWGHEGMQGVGGYFYFAMSVLSGTSRTREKKLVSENCW